MTHTFLLIVIICISSTVTAAETHGSLDPVTDPFNLFGTTENSVPRQSTPSTGQDDPSENDIGFWVVKLTPGKVEADPDTSTATPANDQVTSVDVQDNSDAPGTNNVDVQAIPAAQVDKHSTDEDVKPSTEQVDKPPTSQIASPEVLMLSRLITNVGLEISKTIHQNDEQGTVLFSPLSISTLMTLLMGGMGKQSKTYLETFDLLGYNNVTSVFRKIKDYQFGETISVEEFIHQLYQKLLTDLSIQNDKISFKMRTQIFLQENDSNTTDILNSYTEMAKENYQAGIEALDFYSDPFGAANIINEWVNNSTDGKIPKLLTDPLSPQTKFMAVNTVYFKAPWKFPFSSDVTAVQTFDTGREKIDIPFMIKIIGVKYLPQTSDALKASVVELPYKGDRYSMFIIKPTDPASLDSVIQVENKLNAGRINLLVSSIKMQQSVPMWVEIPRMRLRYRTNLKVILEKMGASSMFSIKDADFSRLTSSNEPILDNMIHEAVMDITEEGTEAAAATSSVLNRFGTSLSFVLDQPSLLFIYDSKTKIPIFWARLVTPESI